MVINGFLKEMHFWKFLIVMIFATGVLWQKMDAHMSDTNLHKDKSEQAILGGIALRGFTYTQAEKLKNEVIHSRLQQDVDHINQEIARLYDEGRAQTPREKRKLMEKVIDDYLTKKNGK